MASVTTSRPADSQRSTHRPGRDVPGSAVLLAAIAILVTSIALVEIPYFALIPGPAEDVVGLIDVGGVDTDRVNGRLLLTTVSVVEDVRIGGAVRDWIDPNYTIVPRSALIGPDESKKDAERRVTEQMTQSQDRAAAAALSLLGHDVRITHTGARVLSVATDGPASRLLKRGDLIVAADSQPVRNPDDLERVTERHRVGDEIVLEIMRGGARMTVRSETVARPDDPTDPIIGVVIEAAPRVDLPLAVKIDSLQIGGPSAGLMFALGIVDLLNGSDLTKGRTVAGTGEIAVDGTVGPVGGVRQKIGGARSRGATLFLVPLAELSEACAAASDLSVVGIENLRDAVRVLTEGERSRDRVCRS